jgi:hypothetical protein
MRAWMQSQFVDNKETPFIICPLLWRVKVTLEIERNPSGAGVSIRQT